MNNLHSQSFYKISGENLVLNNDYIERELKITGDSIYSYRMILNSGRDNYISKSREFSFSINDTHIDGYNRWELLSTQPIYDDHSGQGVKIILKSKIQGIPLNLEVSYMLYTGLPLIRKWIRFSNSGIIDLKLEGVNVEDIQSELSPVHSVVYHNYGRMKQLGSYTGNWDDPVIVIHDITNRRGIAVGNESPGILKRTAYNTTGNNIEAGLTHPGRDFPFRKWLKPGESWESPKVFVCLYENTDDGFNVINDPVNRFVVEIMNPQIYQLKDKPTFVYNTWYPFRTFINDSLARDVARAAADCGLGEMILDDGWQVNIGGTSS